MLFMEKIRMFWLWFLHYFSDVSNEPNGEARRCGTPWMPSAQKPAVCRVRGNSNYDICLTEGCVFAASDLLASMNTAVDPCEDFYEYACGGWVREHQIPDDKAGYGTFDVTADKIEQQMKELLETNETPAPKYAKMARTVYEKCMNRKEIEAIQTKELIELLRQIGQWPVLEKTWNDNSAVHITYVLASLIAYGIGDPSIFQVSIITDIKNATYNVITLDEAILDLGNPENYFDRTGKSKLAEAYKKYQLSTLKLVLDGANVTYDEFQLKADVDDMAAFETEIAKITVSGADRRNAMRMYNRIPIANLYALLPQVDWLRFFLSFTSESIHDVINNDTDVIVKEISFLEKLSRLLTVTSKRTLFNFIFWRTVKKWTSLLPEKFDAVVLELRRVTNGQRTLEAQWQECLGNTIGHMSEATGALFIQKHFSMLNRREAMDMLTNIQKAFKDIVKEIDWMDRQTKRIVLEKADAMVDVIGYDDIIVNDTALGEYYAKLTITPEESYFKILTKISLWKLEKVSSSLKKPVDKSKLIPATSSVNAFYGFSSNVLTFPAGILRPPFFSAFYPKAVNYGAIGSVMGHEITHGFDDYGSQYDKEGSLFNWWSNISYRNFVKKTECFVQQYGNYEVPDIGRKVNGKLTLGENIADNGGIKESYKAYRNYIEQRGCEEPRLPGMQNYTNDQLFFLSYARIRCVHFTKQAKINQIRTDSHAPDMFRVNGVMANMREFSEAFKCRRGSRLNPRRRCAVW